MRILLKPRDAFLPLLHAGEGWIVRAGGIADVLPQKEARGSTLADHHKKTDGKPSTIARNGDFA